MIISWALTACSVYVFYIFINFLCKFYKVSHIPGPLCVPLVSHLTIGISKDFNELLDILRDYRKCHGNFFKIWCGPRLFFYINKPEYLKVILNSQNCLDKGSSYKFLSKFLGNGLVPAPASIWKVHRKIINPTYSQSLFTSRLSVINKSAEDLIEILKQNSDERDILNDVTNCLLDVTFETMFEFQLDALKNNESLSYALKALGEISMSRMVKIWLHPEFLFRTTELSEKFVKAKKKLDDFALNVFTTKMSEPRDEFEETNDRYFFAHLLKYYRNNEFSKEDFLDEIKVLAAAGAETSSCGICFCLTFLGMHEEIQNKIYEEVIENVADREITVGDLQNLKYTECVVKESLRLAPVLLFVSRTVTDDIDLDKYTIPKDSEIFFSIMDLHRDEKYWPDPLKFDPDRFLPENSSKIYPYSYLPFSAGPRNCIGQKQGLISMKIILAHVIRNFKVSTSCKSVEEMEFLPHVVTKAKGGFKIKLEKRF